MYIKIYVLSVFLVSYFLIATSKRHPLPILYAAILLLIISPALNLVQAFRCININVMGVFWGTMVLSYLFVYSGVPSLLAGKLVNKTKTVAGAILAVCGLAGFISSYTENVATLLIVGPIALEIAKRLGIDPVPVIIGVAVSSNLQGCATMIGDSPSIILASASGMSFNDFFWMQGRPGIFFAVQIGAIGSFLVLYLVFRKYRQKTQDVPIEPVKTWIPALLVIGLVWSLVISSFIKGKPKYTVAIICILWGLAGSVWHHFRHREALDMLKGLDWKTFFFLIGIFILIGSLTENGIIDDVARAILKITGDNKFIAFNLIVWLSVLVSAFVDNIPYTVAMIPVAQFMARNLGVSGYPFLFGLLIGTCIGGNITPIGASCNVAGVGMLRRYGYRVGFLEFVKLGLPFTIVAVVLASMFIWFVWMY